MVPVLLGRACPAEPLGTAELGCPLPMNDQREDYLRAALDRTPTGALRATPFHVQDSSMFARLAEADCLVVRRPYAPAAEIGDRVEFMRLGGSIISV